jgi:hypothetical protein
MTEKILTVREMRQAITRAAYGRERVDGKTLGLGAWPPASPLASKVLRCGEHEGWSGEDTMTVLAYEALKAYEQMHDLVIQNLNAHVNPPVRLVPAASEQKTLMHDLMAVVAEKNKVIKKLWGEVVDHEGDCPQSVISDETRALVESTLRGYK